MHIRNIQVYDYANSDLTCLQDILLTSHGNYQIATSALLKSTTIKQTIDAQGKYCLMPGWLDSHVHGYGGHDFSDANADNLPVIMQALGNTGLAYCMATLVSLSFNELSSALAAINDYVVQQASHPTKGATTIIGVHLEGPFIAKNCRGAHKAEVLRDTIDLPIFQTIIAHAPDIKYWKITLAPQLDGALQFIEDVKLLAEQGIFVSVSLGHCNPELAITSAAIAKGARGFTHLGNGCMETCCRLQRSLTRDDANSKLVQWVLQNPSACPAGVELITDGIHISSSFFTLLHETIGNKYLPITDALGPSGCEDGSYDLGPLGIIKQGEAFYLEDPVAPGKIKIIDGAKKLAGSGAAYHTVVQRMASWLALHNTELWDQIYQATIINARNATLPDLAKQQLPDEYNFVILDSDGNLALSMCNRQIRKATTPFGNIDATPRNALTTNSGMQIPGNSNKQQTMAFKP